MFQIPHQALKTIKTILHVIFIAALTFNLFRRAVFSIPNDWLFFFTSAAVENFVCAVIAYMSYYIGLKSNSIWRKIGLAIFSIALLLALALLKDYRIHEQIAGEQTFDYFTGFLGRSLLFYLFVFLINRFEFFRKYLEMEKELGYAKEQLLRDQLHPHFLFNAFNSLYSLSLKNHSDTPEYILKLSTMMRYLTDETHLSKVPLYREIDFIEKYIALEKIRFGEDARVQFGIEGSRGKWIEPFLLITLVENAFKHGFYTNIKSAFVRIHITITDEELLFTVENSIFDKQHFQESGRTGKGLDNLKARLKLLYPKNSTLMLNSTANTYTAQLKIELNDEIV